MDPRYHRLLEPPSTKEDLAGLVKLADEFQAEGKPQFAATAIDRAYGLDPLHSVISQERQILLDQLAVKEHGLLFRYVPAGTFMMGSTEGDPDEQPVHAVQLDHFWISETPVSWADYCRLMSWELPPIGQPTGISLNIKKLREEDRWILELFFSNKIRLQYCENETLHAQDWHRHAPDQMWKKGADGRSVSARKLFGEPPRADTSKAWGYDAKPMIAVSWDLAQKLCSKLSESTSGQQTTGLISSLFSRKQHKRKDGQASATRIGYRLPTEAEWEKAARGGLLGCRYPWGNEPATAERCDFGRFEEFSVLPMKRFVPNGYGLYAVSGCVWEWVADWYDSQFYSVSPGRNPSGPSSGKLRVVRGGSWSDCAEAVTVSFRMSMGGDVISAANPNTGFRLCRSDG